MAAYFPTMAMHHAVVYGMRNRVPYQFQNNQQVSMPMHQASLFVVIMKLEENLNMNQLCVGKRGRQRFYEIIAVSRLLHDSNLVECCTQFPCRPRLGHIDDDQEETTTNPTALEKALRNFVIRKEGLVVQPSVGTKFDSMVEAFEFYNLYSWEVGFGIRFDGSRRNSERTKTIQDIVCICAVSVSLCFPLIRSMG